MGMLNALFGRGKGLKNLKVTQEELDLLFLSPDFVQRYASLSENQKDDFLAKITKDQLRHFLDQGRAMEAKRIKDLGH